MATVVKNIGQLLTGDINNPLSDADSIIIEDGKIKEVGKGLSEKDGDKVIDAMGAAVGPGLFDTHSHVTIGDYAHRQYAYDFIVGELHGHYLKMVEMTGSGASVLVGSGNGLRRNPLMRRIAENLFGLTLQIPAHMEEAAYGAALCALAAAGRVRSLSEAQRMIRYIGA